MWFQIVGDIKGMRLFSFMMARSTPLNYTGMRRMGSENANSN